MLTILFDEAEERGIEKGRREGRRIGKKEEAERYVEQTLKQRKAAARRRGTLKNGEGNEKKQS